MNEIIKKNGIQFGIIIGIVAILFQIIIYVSGEALYKNVYLGFLFTTLYWVIRIYQANKTKKDLHNTITLKEVFTTLLISTSIGILISVSFNYVFYNFIASDLKPEVNKFMNLKQLDIQKMFNKGNLDENQILNFDNFSFGNLFKGAIFSILISSIFNLILAAIFKTKTSNQY